MSDAVGQYIFAIRPWGQGCGVVCWRSLCWLHGAVHGVGRAWFRAAQRVEHSGRYDACRPLLLHEFLSWVATGRLWLLCIAPPCMTWSIARCAVRCGWRAATTSRITVRLLRPARQYGAHSWIDNVYHSGLWRWPLFAAELRLARCTSHDLHLCTLSYAWKKPTGIATVFPGADKFDRICQGHPEHVLLQGAASGLGLPTKWRTSFA